MCIEAPVWKFADKVTNRALSFDNDRNEKSYSRHRKTQLLNSIWSGKFLSRKLREKQKPREKGPRNARVHMREKKQEI